MQEPASSAARAADAEVVAGARGESPASNGPWAALAGASPRAECLAGVRAELPLLLGVIPFGLIFGAIGLAAGLPAWAVVAMSSVVFGGSSQVVFAQLWGVAPPSVITATVGVVNLRHALYSATLTEWFAGLPWRWKLTLAYLLTDEAYVPAIGRLRDGPPSPHAHWFLFGTGITLWTTWQLATLAGVLIGAAIPASWSLGFSIPLTFIALVVPALHRRSEIFAALVAVCVAILAQGLPHRLWIIAAAAAGIAAGIAAEIAAQIAGRALKDRAR
ncbi:AzlC family ABC transporter permease [Niveibacterium sp. SC-1]|uniref:AzlC family ABC transporter permease n=1 Tax=Niveibacterium sp. SC-1 TaxID=3135646 RepID=UPI00312003A5